MLNFCKIYRSLHKPNLFFGAEREPVLAVGVMALALTFSSFSPFVGGISLLIWIIALFFLRIMAKKDAMLAKIWLRHIRYQAFYPAKTGIWQRTQGKRK
jgi:type IV secretion system protein VirB3